jgi:hypothetical protein
MDPETKTPEELQAELDALTLAIATAQANLATATADRNKAAAETLDFRRAAQAELQALNLALAPQLQRKAVLLRVLGR